MDILALTSILLAALVSAVGGGYLVMRFIPHDTLEISVSRAFQEGQYQKVLDLISVSRKKNLSDSVLLFHARSYARTGRPAEALGVYQKLLGRLQKGSPIYASIYLEQGDIYLKQKEYAAAQGSYLMGLDAAPQSPFLRYKMALTLSETGDHRQARLILRGLLKDNPKLADARLLYADTLAALGFYDKAIQHYGMMDRAGEKVVSYGYAKTLKELKIIDRGIGVYRSLLKSQVDARRRTEMILDCARLYLQSRQFSEAQFFIEDFLPSLRDEDHLEMRYIRASLLVKRGDEYAGLQEFTLLHEEAPAYKDLAAIVERGDKILKMPFLKNYFTADAAGFEKTLLAFLPAGASCTKRSPDCYVFCAGNRAFAFYRHYYPAPRSVIDEIDISYPQYCLRAGILEFWSFSGLSDPDIKLTRGDYTIMLHSGGDFAKFGDSHDQDRNIFPQLKGNSR